MGDNLSNSTVADRHKTSTPLLITRDRSWQPPEPGGSDTTSAGGCGPSDCCCSELDSMFAIGYDFLLVVYPLASLKRIGLDFIIFDSQQIQSKQNTGREEKQTLTFH